ncbi:metallopeptidase family protein [Corynebacterium sp. H128]|uniref:metallopeptidase family protein n=1 Tax=Corynebacterium sp. H128 TaxID=3133427 RepID=UPI0030A2734F
MISVSQERFEELVDMGLELVPHELLNRLENAVILIEDYHPEGPHILGLYEGVALPERTAEYSGFLPDAITIYRQALQDYCRTEEELVEQVKTTVIHEIGHYFGLDDEELHRLGWG